MILDILQHTPLWVFAIFVALVVLGARRTRANTLGVRRLLILPIVMTGFSLFGLTHAFGGGLVPLAAWSLAFGAMLVGGLLRPLNARVQYSSATRTIHVPGSWLPLALMMTIFFLRYAVGVLLAMHPGLSADTSFAAVVGALYGLSAGAFAARALVTWRSAFALQSGASTLATA